MSAQRIFTVVAKGMVRGCYLSGFVRALRLWGEVGAGVRCYDSGNVKIAILGGGPAGLYLALLLKKADAAHRVTVLERNRPDDTFGWGVVFSQQTLGNLRAADPESFGEIAGNF